MTVKIRTRTVGSYFATVGQIVTARGRVVAETTLVPYGFTGVATDRAAALADAFGWTVVS